MYRDLLIHMTSDTAGERRLTYALALAETLNARLTGTEVLTTPDVPPVYKPSSVPEVAHALQSHASREASAAEALFASLVKRRPIASRWVGAKGDLVGKLVERARYADLLIVGQEGTEVSPELNPFNLADQLLSRSGRPLIIVPEHLANPPQPRRILIAWDGSREAVRAVHDALPLLRAGEVSIVAANPEDEHLAKDISNPTDLIDHLQMHGVIARHHHARRSRSGTERALLADSQHFDFLVMGAYGRLPLWELLFGGVTVSTIRKSGVPIFMSH